MIDYNALTKINCGRNTCVFAIDGDSTKIVKIGRIFKNEKAAQNHIKAAKHDLATPVYYCMLQVPIKDLPEHIIKQLISAKGETIGYTYGTVDIAIMARAEPVLSDNTALYSSAATKKQLKLRSSAEDEYATIIDQLYKELLTLGIAWLDCHVGNLGVYNDYYVVTDF